MESRRMIWRIAAVIAMIVMSASMVLLSVGTQGNTIKIGVITPLSGPAAFWGESTALGASLAKNDLEREGIMVMIISEDGQIDAQKSLNAAQKLVNVDGVKAIYTEFASAGIAVSSFLADKSIIHIFDAAVISPLYDSPNNYKSYMDYTMNCKEVAVSLKKEGVTQVGMLLMNSEIGILCEKGIREIFPSLEVFSYNPGEMDFRTLALQSRGMEAIFNPGFPSEVVASLRQLRESGSEAIFIAPSDALGGVEDLNRTNVITFGLPSVDMEFQKRISRELGSHASSPEAAALAYLHVKQLAYTLNRCKEDIVCARRSMDAMPIDRVISFQGYSNHVAQFNLSIIKN